jgi:hypothetical protein
MCKQHYYNLRLYGHLTLRRRLSVIERFERLIERIPQSGCWIWMGSVDRRGYGRFSPHRIARKAHRVAYELFVGPIPPRMGILHSCDIPSCVNPSHLRPGTQRDNTLDAIRRGRHVPLPQHRGDRAVAVAASIVGVIFVALTAGGFA